MLKNPQIKIIDMDESRPVKQLSRTVIGTVQYRAPEVEAGRLAFAIWSRVSN